MLSILFVTLFLLTLLFFFLLVKLSAIDLLKPSITSIFFLGYLLFSYIGLLSLFFGMDDYRILIGINNPYKVLRLWFYCSLSLYLVIIGFIFSNKVLGMRDINKSSFEIQTLGFSTKGSIFLLFGVSLIVFIVYLSKLPAIPIVEFLKGSSEANLQVLRSLATNDFSGDYHWYTLFFSTILTLLTYLTFAELLINKNLKNQLIFWMVFLIASFAAIVPTHKAPFIWLIFGLLFTYLITKRKRVSLIQLISLGFLIIVILFFMFKYFMGLENRTNAEIFSMIFNRTTSGQLTPAYFYIDIFPNEIGYLLGSSFPNPGGIFPWDPFNLKAFVANYINSGLTGQGIVGSAPTVFWGEMYANFGFFAVVISSFVVGILLYSIQYFVSRLSNNSITIALNTWLIIEFHKLALTGLSSFIINIDIIAVVLIVGFLLLQQNSRKRGASV
ncbi:O-antigen polymerase [Oceanobacillus damuensis]|uniref:O-antigen polymerase n=1 Tax=Oceanobacillus damuensis TaxID=937928 RepID=UPI000831EF1E|nr:O-antigen polymerase [Oceanobacillus damuensis]